MTNGMHLVRAIELKEANPSTILHLINVGGPENDPIIRKALALGGDEAIRVNSNSHDDFYIASQIAEVAKQNNYDLIFTGKETIDYNGSSIGGMIAELLNLPFISLATKFSLEGNVATVEREIEGGEEVDEVSPSFSSKLPERNGRTKNTKYARNYGSKNETFKSIGTNTGRYFHRDFFF